MKDFVFDLIKNEKRRQSEGLELIPSENYVSPEVLEAMGSVLTNKYSEGYPSFEGIPGWGEDKIVEDILPNYRYYGGQDNVDRIERLAIDRACRLFDADHANVQPHSGANANEAVYFAWCDPGDKILAMSLPAGGHLTHGSPVTRSAKIYNFISYGVTDDGDIDYEELEKKALEEQPKIILVGYSAFMKIPDFKRVAEIGAKIPGCLLMADMAHVAGLIAGGVHPNPLKYGFHVMTTTTHKTLRGPRGGIILSRGNVASPLRKPEKTLENIPILIDRAVFPGTQGGPLEHVIAAKAVAFGEALQPEFKTYAMQVKKNAAVMAQAFMDKGYKVVSGGTDNHSMLIDLRTKYPDLTGKVAEKALVAADITTNKNMVPFDTRSAFQTSGLRFGTPAITTRGLKEDKMPWIVELIDQVLQAPESEANIAKVREIVNKEMNQYPLFAW